VKNQIQKCFMGDMSAAAMVTLMCAIVISVLFYILSIAIYNRKMQLTLINENSASLNKNEKMPIDTFSNKTFCAIICSNENYIVKYMRKSNV